MCRETFVRSALGGASDRRFCLDGVHCLQPLSLGTPLGLNMFGVAWFGRTSAWHGSPQDVARSPIMVRNPQSFAGLLLQNLYLVSIVLKTHHLIYIPVVELKLSS